MAAERISSTKIYSSDQITVIPQKAINHQLSLMYKANKTLQKIAAKLEGDDFGGAEATLDAPKIESQVGTQNRSAYHFIYLKTGKSNYSMGQGRNAKEASCDIKDWVLLLSVNLALKSASFVQLPDNVEAKLKKLDDYNKNYNYAMSYWNLLISQYFLELANKDNSSVIHYLPKVKKHQGQYAVPTLPPTDLKFRPLPYINGPSDRGSGYDRRQCDAERITPDIPNWVVPAANDDSEGYDGTVALSKSIFRDGWLLPYLAVEFGCQVAGDTKNWIFLREGFNSTGQSDVQLFGKTRVDLYAIYSFSTSWFIGDDRCSGWVEGTWNVALVFDGVHDGELIIKSIPEKITPVINGGSDEAWLPEGDVKNFFNSVDAGLKNLSMQSFIDKLTNALGTSWDFCLAGGDDFFIDKAVFNAEYDFLCQYISVVSQRSSWIIDERKSSSTFPSRFPQSKTLRLLFVPPRPFTPPIPRNPLLHSNPDLVFDFLPTYLLDLPDAEGHDFEAGRDFVGIGDDDTYGRPADNPSEQGGEEEEDVDNVYDDRPHEPGSSKDDQGVNRAGQGAKLHKHPFIKPICNKLFLTLVLSVLSSTPFQPPSIGGYAAHHHRDAVILLTALCRDTSYRTFPTKYLIYILILQELQVHARSLSSAKYIQDINRVYAGIEWYWMALEGGTDTGRVYGAYRYIPVQQPSESNNLLTV
ncbi:hypothetical protein SISNIDRAFT_535889 [Sistotremastrum niveocremeum HHB9708]|uniref:Uncharacterized protein n=1 Tax=Sistotremastrum niveocremeum HHB9708 TaxID=1314777 RepID=A0A164N695_9AGAM|nr:hypothetical protein SISNIDRAFT_535889 [Sistotremastrum niveocremeum HHB9708]